MMERLFKPTRSLVEMTGTFHIILPHGFGLMEETLLSKRTTPTNLIYSLQKHFKASPYI